MVCSVLDFLSLICSTNSLMYYTYDLYVRHGLGFGTLSGLKNAISIEPPTAFTVSQKNAATISLHGIFNPETTYSIYVRGNSCLLDGWKLPLLSSNTTFKTQKCSAFITEGFDVAAQFEEFNQYWTILSRDIYTFCNTTNLHLTPITSQNLLGALGSSLLGSPSSFPPIPLPQRNPTLLDVTDVPTEYLLSSGLFYVEQYIYTPDSGEACWKTVRPCSWAL